MRVIEQLVQHFWTRGALTQDEALYLVKHGFVREADLAGLTDRAAETETREFDDLPEVQVRGEKPGGDSPFDGIHAEQLEDELTGRNAGGGKKGGKKKKPAGHNLAPAASHLSTHLAAREPYPALQELGTRLGSCGTWRDAARRVASAKSAVLESALVGLLTTRPRALGELWFWFDLEPLFEWAEHKDNVGPVADGIGKLLRADVPGRVGRLDQLKKAIEVQALIDLLAARRPFLALLPVLYNRYFDRLGSWLIPPAGVAALAWPALPWAFVITYNARNRTLDESQEYPLPLDNVPTQVIRDALRTAFPMDPEAIRELLRLFFGGAQDAMPDDSELPIVVAARMSNRSLYCPLTWKV